MKPKILFSIMFVLLFLPLSYSANPTGQYILTNDVLVSPTVYEVDLILKTTSASPMELAAIATGLTIPTASQNGGTLTCSIVAGSTELSNTTQAPTANPNSSTVSGTGIDQVRVIKIAGKTPPGSGAGSLIALTGTRIMRLRLTNTVAWVSAGSNTIDFAPAALYPTAVSIYVDNVNTNLTLTGDVTNVKDLIGPLLPVELTSFVSNVSGRQVNLNWETKTEVNSNKYEIERASNGVMDATAAWVSVGTVQAAGMSNSPKKYSFIDKNLQAGKYQYRLKMIDNDGSFKFSDVVETEVSLPKNFELTQNYPNPFNPSTKIEYQVPVDAKIILEVYNIAGQKVTELVNQDQPAGYYSVSFGSSSNKLASGVYIYRIAATEKANGKNFSSIKKMMLLK
jgi:hypothetical protein